MHAINVLVGPLHLGAAEDSHPTVFGAYSDWLSLY